MQTARKTTPQKANINDLFKTFVFIIPTIMKKIRV